MKELSFLIILIAMFQANSQVNDLLFIYNYCFNGETDIANLELISENDIFFYKIF